MSYFYILSSLKSSFSSSSESFYPKLVITFLNYLTVIVDPFGLNIDCIASISSSSAYGSLYSLDKIVVTWPWELRSQQIRIFLYYPCQQSLSIRLIQLKLGFGLMNALIEAVTNNKKRFTLRLTKLSLSLSKSWKAYLNSAIFYSLSLSPLSI